MRVVVVVLLSLSGCGFEKSDTSSKLLCKFASQFNTSRCGVALYVTPSRGKIYAEYTKVVRARSYPERAPLEQPAIEQLCAVLTAGTYVGVKAKVENGECSFQVEPDGSLGPETPIAWFPN